MRGDALCRKHPGTNRYKPKTTPTPTVQLASTSSDSGLKSRLTRTKPKNRSGMTKRRALGFLESATSSLHHEVAFLRFTRLSLSNHQKKKSSK